jgi:antirestriction protein ArdC
MNNAEVYQAVTGRIIAQLKEGTVPWVRPWRPAGARTGILRPVNIASRKPYRGINPFLLEMDAQAKGYTSPWWGTYNQWAGVCGMSRMHNSKTGRDFWGSPDSKPRGIMKGEHGTQIILWKPATVTEADPVTGDKIVKDVLLARMFTVFTAEQCAEVPVRYFPGRAEWEPVEPIRDAQEVLDAYLDGGPQFVRAAQNRAYYDIRTDVIMMPDRDQFTSAEAYYGAAFHEAGHSTGHPSRLNREGITGFDHFGSGQYAKEELVAQMTSAMLQAVTGIETDDEFARSAAYIASWLGKLQDDPKLVSQAASHATQAVDLITEPQRLPEEVHQAEAA